MEASLPQAFTSDVIARARRVLTGVRVREREREEEPVNPLPRWMLPVPNCYDSRSSWERRESRLMSSGSNPLGRHRWRLSLEQRRRFGRALVWERKQV